MNQNTAASSDIQEEGESVYLMVGDLYFGNQAREVKTLLGSCVAITLWHKEHGIGGMCHIALPETRIDTPDPMNTRFADGAINTFIKYIAEIDLQPKNFTVGLYGGGQMFHYRDKESYIDIGAKNLAITKRLLSLHRFRIVEEDVSGPFYRHICLDLKTGKTTLKKTPVRETMD
ncbi:MAG: chemotaxis protein CheD [Gammaproteobacteria bacterium]|nr:chemotaxis protein CheD [Gammaproteobacteria bacterium]